MRRLLAYAGWLVFATIVAATTLVIAIDVGFQRERLRDLAVATIGEELGLEVAVERVDGRASRGLDLRGVRLGPASAPVAEIDRLRVEWRIWRWLVEDERRIERVEIDGATIRLVRDAEGRWRTIDDLRERLAAARDAGVPEDRSTTPPIVVERLTLRRSTVEVVQDERPSEDPAIGPLPVERIVFAAEGRASGYRSGRTEGLPIEAGALALTLVEAVRDGTSLPLLETARLAAELREDGALQASIDATGPGLALEADFAGPVASPGPLRFSLHAEELARLAPWLPEADGLRGRATLAGEVSGLPPLDAIDVDPTTLVATLTIDAAVEGLPPFRDRALPAGLLTVRGRGHLDAGRLRVDEAVVEHAGGLRAALSGTASRERLDDVTLALTVEHVDAWASALVPEAGAVRGERVELRASLDGPVTAPKGTLVARARGLEALDGEPFDLEVSVERVGEEDARLRAHAWDGGEIARDEGADEAPLRIDAAVDPIDRSARIEAAVDGAFLTRVMPAPQPIAGRFDLSGTARLVEAGLDFDVRLLGADVVVDTTPVGALELAARTRNPATSESLDLLLLALEAGVGSAASPRARLERPASLAVDASGHWQIEGLDLALGFSPEFTGEAATASTDPAPRPGLTLDARGVARRPDAATVSVRGVPVEAIAQLVDAVSPMTGRLSLEARFETRGDVVVSEGVGGLSKPTISGQPFDSADLEWTTDAEATRARLALVTAQAIPLELSGRVPLRPLDPRSDLAAILEGATFEATLDGVDLALLAASLPRTLRDPSGRLRGHVEGRIEDGRPRLRGRFDVAEAGITVPLLRRRFSPIDGFATLEDDRLELHELRLGPEEAGAKLHAVLELDEARALPIEAELVLRRLPVSRSALLHADVDGRIAIAGSLAEPRITGRLTLPGLQVRVPAAEDPLLREIRLTAGTSDALVEPTDEKDFVTSSTIDVRLEVPGDARIRGQGAHLYVKGNARLASRPGEPLRVFGEGEVVHGTYTLQGRRFQVRRGSVQLVGDREVDPVLDIEARLPTSDIVAIVDVTGRLSSPIVRLRSEPARSEQDVLAYLLFGRPAEEVGASQSGSMNAAAARLVAGVAERELRDLLGDAMPVDSIEIGADDEGNTSELGFGKYLQPNLYFRYVHVLGDEPADRVGVEYRVNDLISVGSSVSTTGDAGLDLILRHDF